MPSTFSPSRTPQSSTPSSSASFLPSLISSKVVGIITPSRCSQKTQTFLKASISLLLNMIPFPLPQIICFAASMPASLSVVSFPSPGSIMPAPFCGGVNDVRMFVGEPRSPIVLLSISG